MDSPTNTSEELRKLVALIGNAAQTAEKYLLDPKLSTREQTTDPELRTSIYVIEAACAQLCALVARPSDTLTNVSVDTFGFGFLSNHITRNRNLWQSVSRCASSSTRVDSEVSTVF